MLERQFNPFLLSANRLSNKTSDSLTVPQGFHQTYNPTLSSGAMEGDRNRAGLDEEASLVLVILISVTFLLCGHFKLGVITIFASPAPLPQLLQSQATWNDLVKHLKTTEEASRHAFSQEVRGPDNKQMSVQLLDVDSLQQKVNSVTSTIRSSV